MKTFKINGLDYDCEFKLSNPDKQEVIFTKSSIRGMTLIDNIFDPFMSGSISIANPYDFIEKDYFLRGDGRDEFSIKFKPTSSEDSASEFDQTFVIIDDSDMGNPLVRSENIKTFTLISKDAIAFSDKLPYSKIYSGKIGKILKDVFVEVLGEDKVDSDNWEDGDFNIESYIPPATFRYVDVLRYFLKLYYAKDGEIYVKGFINYDKETNKFRLDLLSKIYSKNDKNTIEAFPVADMTDKIDLNNPNNPPSGPPIGGYNGPMKNLGYSTPFYGWTSDYFINSLIFGYDKTLGEHRIIKLKFEDIRKKWKTKFVDVFKSISGEPKPFAIKNNSTDEKFKRYKFPYPVEDGVKMVEADIHNSLTFYNLQASFSNIGSTMRRSGKFVDIFSTRGDQKLKSDEKILGRWYVTEVRHIFFADLYTNQIFCCKTYVGPNSKIDEKCP